jgi:hypothetical protein
MLVWPLRLIADGLAIIMLRQREVDQGRTRNCVTMRSMMSGGMMPAYITALRSRSIQFACKLRIDAKRNVGPVFNRSCRKKTAVRITAPMTAPRIANCDDLILLLAGRYAKNRWRHANQRDLSWLKDFSV